MADWKHPVGSAVSAVETFFDRLKLSYKWRFDRWEGLQVVTYRGFGTREEVSLEGRVLDDQPVEPRHGAGWFRNLRDTLQRIETDEVPGAEVELILGSLRETAETDGDGFFRFRLREPDLDGDEPGRGSWHRARVELVRPGGHDASADLEFLVPGDSVELVVVSDLDDTVIRTGATSRLKMMRTVLLNNPHSRVPFPGVPAFYRALYRGADGHGENPIFFISSSPWNFYRLFEDFLDLHDVPPGPILLKDFGFSPEKLWKRPHEEHKLEHVRNLLRTYPDLPFVLVGDSGQQDPEIFRQVVDEAPERIAAVFLRDVTPPRRDREVHQLGETVERQGVPWVLVETTAEAARRAAELGLVSEASVGEVEEEARRVGAEAEREETAPWWRRIFT